MLAMRFRHSVRKLYLLIITTCLLLATFLLYKIVSIIQHSNEEALNNIPFIRRGLIHRPDYSADHIMNNNTDGNNAKVPLKLTSNGTGLNVVQDKSNTGTYVNNDILAVNENNLGSLRVENCKSNGNADLEHLDLPNYNVHAFYYIWYGSVNIDGEYLHWNHEYISHWRREEVDKWKHGQHNPPHDIGSNYYPQHGSYSSQNTSVIKDHMLQLRKAGIGVISVSWYPPGTLFDDHGHDVDHIIPLVLDIAEQYQIKINFHIEPLKERNGQMLKNNISYILKNYGSHPAFYRRLHKGQMLPMFYIYDSYTIPWPVWASVFKAGGSNSIRGTDLDGIFIGLVVERKHKSDLLLSGFDGFYTYFASKGFTYGSSPQNWQHLAKFAKFSKLIFIPSVGPGYIDTEVRPWNNINTKDRDGGEYYKSFIKSALNIQPSIISITSFNEWHEGTQIETAIRKRTLGRSAYVDYSPETCDFYLTLTNNLLQNFKHDNV